MIQRVGRAGVAGLGRLSLSWSEGSVLWGADSVIVRIGNWAGPNEAKFRIESKRARRWIMTTPFEGRASGQRS